MVRIFEASFSFRVLKWHSSLLKFDSQEIAVEVSVRRLAMKFDFIRVVRYYTGYNLYGQSLYKCVLLIFGMVQNVIHLI